jgi:hypothetical protein
MSALGSMVGTWPDDFSRECVGEGVVPLSVLSPDSVDSDLTVDACEVVVEEFEDEFVVPPSLSES